jgi:hypothetical protein
LAAIINRISRLGLLKPSRLPVMKCGPANVAFALCPSFLQGAILALTSMAR